ncbi:MAG TPA: right-handed parallel beta-helix repeat-containing protein [Candidatus Angelobacter sp.]|jgi:hypothetical protein
MIKRQQERSWIYVLAAVAMVIGGLMLLNGKYHAAQQTESKEENLINVVNQPGSDLGEKLASCIRQLGPGGGTCDARAISGRQSAMADPFAGSDGMVKILLGNVTIETSRPWELPDKVELAGEGRATVLQLAPGANKHLIGNAGHKDGNNGIFIHDLTLDGNNAHQTGQGSTIHFWKVSDFSIERVTVLNSVAHGIALDDGCIRGKVRNNHIEGVAGGSGIRAGNTPPEGKVSFLEISGNEISMVAKANGIFVLGGTSAGEHTHDITISGNTISGVKDTSIEVGDGSQKVIVTTNKITLSQAPAGSSGSTGISARSARNVRIAGNTVIGDPGEHEQVGLLVWSPAKDQGGPLSEVTLENNTVFTIGGYGVKVHSGSGIHLVRNTVRHCAQENIYITEKATGVTQQGNTVE